MSNAAGGLSADTVALLLAMQMLCQPRKENETPIAESYLAAKRCLSYAEENNIFSLRLLQASLLMGLYEIANAIYPAAYLTVGHCARLGHAMGIHDLREAPQMFPLPGSPCQLNLSSPKYLQESQTLGQRLRRDVEHGGQLLSLTGKTLKWSSR